jgi:hypothetical protein
MKLYSIFAPEMKKGKTSIEKQFHIIKLAKGLVVCLLMLSFALEFVMLNFISTYQHKQTVVTSWKQAGDSLVAITDTITVQLSQEWQSWVAFMNKKQEENQSKQTENQTAQTFHLFMEEKFVFQCHVYSLPTILHLIGFYQPPHTQAHLLGVFRPPQA